MASYSISEAKNRLSALLDEVREGASVTITDRGRPVARLEPVLAGEEDQLLAALVRRGLVVRPRGETGDLRRLRPVRTRQTAALVDAVVAERREGR
ncbi:MAG: type II toxin-antitoxin system prevent-host-death family antitoxin [Thermoanaerobaculia bacterium]|nr:type II toxin-antitoxin system prevent-host-death family antitoxin [Thermoanaerobaculia bacterium]MCZ7651415.1 type II toxin-antitoxin system prevent-host-death family antitoxin [Thermoanaerobaculia bacterium]